VSQTAKVVGLAALTLAQLQLNTLTKIMEHFLQSILLKAEAGTLKLAIPLVRKSAIRVVAGCPPMSSSFLLQGLQRALDSSCDLWATYGTSHYPAELSRLVVGELPSAGQELCGSHGDVRIVLKRNVLCE
jgi:hypothetical protein